MKVVIGLCLICALAMPIIFLRDTAVDDEMLRKVTLVYHFIENIYTNQTGWYTNDRADSLSYIVSYNNMRAQLSSQYYYDFPLAVDTESWELNDTVNIGSHSATIYTLDWLSGYYCWWCQTEDDGPVLSYDNATGILVQSALLELDYERAIILEEITFEPPDHLYVKEEGVFLAGIFLELAVIIWQISDRLKKSK